jgi:ADP-heptose:LPS heptosyltransferase
MTGTSPDSVAVFSYEEIIGDGLYKLPFVRALRAAWPSARITWITTRRTVYAGKLQPVMDGLIDEFRQDSGIGRSPAGIILPLPWRERFSVIIDTQTTLWRTLTLRRLPHGLFISPAANFRLSDRKPGAGKRFKCWPLDRFIAVAAAQAERGRVPVFILGPDELEWLAPIREAVPSALFPEQDKAIWGEGFTPLRTIALARRFTAALANDSGVSHMFGAADAPLITLFGPTPAEKFQPKVTLGGVITAQEFGGEAMTDIPVQSVIERLDQVAIHRTEHGDYPKNR